MKTAIFCFLAVALPVLAQVKVSNIVEKSAHFRVTETVTTESIGGEDFFTTNRITELSNSMHFWTGKEWEVSDASFELTPEGAVANKLRYKLIVAPNIMDDGAIDWVTPDNKRFRANPAFLAYRDLTTGESAMVSIVQSASAKLWEKDVILFENCFQDVLGTIRIFIAPTGITQDVIVFAPFPEPGDLGLDPNNPHQLEMWSLFLEAPKEDAQRIQSAGKLTDVCIDFGETIIDQGKAFELGVDGKEIPVAKRWGPAENPGEYWLVESVHMDDAGPILKNLQANAAFPKKVRNQAAIKAKSDKELAAAFGRNFTKKSGEMIVAGGPTMPLKNGFLIDFTTLDVNKTNYVFSSDATTYISSAVTLEGLTTVMPGTVIKFSPTNTAKLTIKSNLLWVTSQSGVPAVFTARDDHSVGEQIGTAVLTNHAAEVALYIDATAASAGVNIDGMRVSHAKTAVQIQGRTDHVLSNLQFNDCSFGVKIAGNAAVKCRNVLMTNVRTNFNGGTPSTAHVEHLTSDSADYLNGSTSSTTINLTNSLVVAVNNLGTLGSTQNVAVLSIGTGVFATALSCRWYLANNTYRNVGTTNVSILPLLRKTTTYAPVILTGPISVSTTFRPTAPRDTDLPDYGWHAMPIDLLVKELDVSADVTLTGGVVVGVYGTNGLTLLSGSKILSTGNLDQMNRIIKSNVAQAGTNILDGGSTTFSLLKMTSTPAVRPDINLRFTDVSLLADIPNRKRFLDAGSGYTRFTPNSMHFRDSEFLNASIAMYPDTLGFVCSATNCLFQSSVLAVSDGSVGSLAMTANLQNNTFLNGTCALTHNLSTYTWAVYDTFFETVALTGGSVTINNSHNGYRSTTVLSGTSGSNVTIYNLDYVTGPLGSYYYPTTGTNLNYLRNVGKQASAANVGLARFTTTADVVQEGSTQLDLGYHTICTESSSSTKPKDSDGDFLADVREDADGDNVVDSGETDPAIYNSTYGIGTGPGLVIFTPLK